jgi:putative Ca2+/H+ antiporter (TMEM165/GDT1 family)
VIGDRNAVLEIPGVARYTLLVVLDACASLGRLFLEAFLFSTTVVALAEMGDKTQLLSFVLAAKLKHKLPIALGILVATLANHFLAGYVGTWLSRLVSPDTLRWIIALSFFAFAAWALKPDKLDESRRLRGTGVFLTTVVAFFMVEMGDKTQLATVALAARYDSLVAVVLGTTLGMMIANVPAVWLGEALADRVNMKVMRGIAAALFLLLGVLALFAGTGA